MKTESEQFTGPADGTATHDLAKAPAGIQGLDELTGGVAAPLNA